MKYRRKPIEIEAMRFDGTPEDAAPIIDWIRRHQPADTTVQFKDGTSYAGSIVLTGASGASAVFDTGWIIRDEHGIFCYARPDVFEATYFPTTPAGIAATVTVLLTVAENAGKGFANEVTHRIRTTAGGTRG